MGVDSAGNFSRLRSKSSEAMNIHKIYRFIFRIWRKQRFQLFHNLIQPTSRDRLLDIGGTVQFWQGQHFGVGQITVLNLHPQNPADGILTKVGDGCDTGEPAASYDIAFSNSVIEHVGAWENQRRMAKEIRKVGKAVWVQTPAFECPLEPHYLAPFIHWLPKSVQKRWIRWVTPMGWISKPSQQTINDMVDTTRLLTRTEMTELFPDCEILTERLLGVIPKSYIAMRTRQISGEVQKLG